MNYEQLKNHVVIPMLEKIPKGLTPESTLAVMMIIAHESRRGEYLVQIQGPALGLEQMEPLTHNDTWKHGDSIWRNALICGIITQEQFDKKIHPLATRLIYDLAYGVFMCRQRLFMKKGALPKSIDEMSVYLNKHWNSAFGAANDDSYSYDYNKWSK